MVAGILLLLWPENPAKLKEERLGAIEKKLERQMKLLEDDGDKLLHRIAPDSVNLELINLPLEHLFLVYKNGALVFWNDHDIIPEYRYLRGDSKYNFLRMPGGQFITRRWTKGSHEIVGLLPLFRDYKISNKYVEPHFNKEVFSFQPERLVEASFETGYKVCLGDECLFQVVFKTQRVIPEISKRERIGASLLLLSFIAALWFILIYRQRIFINLGIVGGSIFIVSSFVISRLAMLYFNFPRRHFDLPLFDTTAFASSWINPTIGDMLFNLLIILLLVILLFDYRNYVLKAISNSALTHFRAFFMVLLYYGSSIFLYVLVQTIYHNSQIGMDITQSMSFDELRIASYLILIIATSFLFLIGHLVVLTFDQLVEKNSMRAAMLSGAFLLFIILSFVENLNYIIPLLLATIVFVVTLVTKLYRSINKIRFATYIYVFSWAVTAALIIAYATMKLEEEKEFQSQQRFAEKFLIENDALAEFLLHDLNNKIEEDLFIQNKLSSPFPGKDVIKDKIRQVHLSGYFDKYDISIYLFDSQGRPFNSQNFMLRPADIKINNQKYATEHTNIYYIDDPNDQIAGRYLDLIEVKKRGLRAGYILLDLRLKKIIPEDVYPELLVDHRFLQPFQNKSYSYALFHNGEVGYSSGKFNYESNFTRTLLKNEDLYRKGINTAGYLHSAIKDTEGNTYIISLPAHGMEHLFSNFSFFFLLVVFVVMVVSLIYAISFIITGSELYYSARIQLYLSLAFFIPMLIVTIITLSLVSTSFKEEVNRENEKKAANMARSIADEYMNAPYDNQLVTLLSKASKFADADANIFGSNGKLMATSQPMIYESHLLSTYINPLALYNIKYKNEQLYTANEAVGSLHFNTTYYSIKSPESGKLLGILSVPYFQSEAAFERNEIDIFTNIISIFTVIFLLFLVISYLASEYLTFPLKIITKKLQKTSLDFNEPLSWEANDEIGLMVKEYNKMVMNLEESKKALARTEKESAWREMAQQVAHEIKNPLTPMKLTLQHLQRTAVDKDEKWTRSINTLLHQVDTLSEIASSFSNFARMPSPAKERFDFGKLLDKTISLYTNTEGVIIHYESIRSGLIVEADEQLMGRIISNILINAIEAGEGYHPLEIDIKVDVNHAKSELLLSIADNGPGVEEGVREKIFTPHFSTKKAGSGIGLAIARRGVEHAGGEIWFETEEGKGTTFYIQLPVFDV